jgi:hypothetical protein
MEAGLSRSAFSSEIPKLPMTLLLLKGNTKSIVKVPLAYGKMLKLPREISQKRQRGADSQRPLFAGYPELSTRRL